MLFWVTAAEELPVSCSLSLYIYRAAYMYVQYVPLPRLANRVSLLSLSLGSTLYILFELLLLLLLRSSRGTTTTTVFLDRWASYYLVSRLDFIRNEAFNENPVVRAVAFRFSLLSRACPQCIFSRDSPLYVYVLCLLLSFHIIYTYNTAVYIYSLLLYKGSRAWDCFVFISVTLSSHHCYIYI